MHLYNQNTDEWGFTPKLMADVISVGSFTQPVMSDEFFSDDGQSLGHIRPQKSMLILGNLRQWATWGLCPLLDATVDLPFGTAICVKRLVDGVITLCPVSLVTYKQTNASKFTYVLSLVSNFQGVFTSVHRHSWTTRKILGDNVYGAVAMTISDMMASSIPSTHTRMDQRPYMVIYRQVDNSEVCYIGTASVDYHGELSKDQASRIIIPLSGTVEVFPTLIPVL